MRYNRPKYNVPTNDKRACLCRDGSYSRKCCNSEDYFAQGIGSLTGPIGYLKQENFDFLLQEDNSKIEL